MVSTETKGYRDKEHMPRKEAIELAKIGDSFIVDHVRVFDIIK